MKRSWTVAIISGAALIATADDAIQYQNVAPSIGLDFTHTPVSLLMPYYMAAGGAAGDFNNDGWLDLFLLSGGGAPDRLYINDGAGRFSDQAAAWGVARTHRGFGACVGDYDRDGWLDIFVTSWGTDAVSPGRHLLYRNLGGAHFEEVALAAGVNRTSPDEADGFGAAFGDYDLDGDLDLAVCGWNPQSDGNRLFRNEGDGTFTDVTAAARLGNMRPVRGFSVRFADMNGDRHPELLWVGDYHTSRYFVNNLDGTFSDRTTLAGVGVETNGMGSVVADINGDGRLDWYVSSIYLLRTWQYGNTLYLNSGGDRFSEIAQAAGVDDCWWGWGVDAVDLNHDGAVDLLGTNGFTGLYWENRAARAFVNLGNNTFSDRAAEYGIAHQGNGRGLLHADLDNDGTPELIFLSFAEPIEVYRRNPPAADENWLYVLLDTARRRDVAPHGFGARIVIRSGETTQVRYVDGGCNYVSQSELAAHFGVGTATVIDELRVEWPNGRDTVLRNIDVNQRLTVVADLLGNSDADADVDLADLARTLSAFGACEGDPRWLADADTDADGCISLADVFALLRDFGLTY